MEVCGHFRGGGYGGGAKRYLEVPECGCLNHVFCHYIIRTYALQSLHRVHDLRPLRCVKDTWDVRRMRVDAESVILSRPGIEGANSHRVCWLPLHSACLSIVLKKRYVPSHRLLADSLTVAARLYGAAATSAAWV